MGKRPPSTPALRLLRQADVAHRVHVIPYVEKGGTGHTATTLGVDEHRVIKTLIFEDETRAPLCVLMHGDCQVSEKALARVRGTKKAKPCAPATAEKHSGYRVGGTSPFGLRAPMSLYAEAGILALERIVINGGARGVLVEISPEPLVRLLGATPVQVALP